MYETLMKNEELGWFENIISWYCSNEFFMEYKMSWQSKDPANQ